MASSPSFTWRHGLNRRMRGWSRFATEIESAWSEPGPGSREPDATSTPPTCSTRRGRSTSSRSARHRRRIESSWSWRPGSGAHILCQKPAALVRSDLLSMIEACTASGVRLMIHENWRFRPWYRAMRAEIDSGAIGRPIRLRIAHRDTRALRPDGFALQPYFAKMPRLILMDMGCHLVDTARYLFGEIQTVSATIGRFGQTDRRRGRGDAAGFIRERGPGLARLQLVHGSRPIADWNGRSTRRWSEGPKGPCGS